MIGQRKCPICKTPAMRTCAHLALACEARDFVRRCVESCSGQAQWEKVCQLRLRHARWAADSVSAREDFTWLETAFCDEFLKGRRWFGGLDFEWRSGPKLEQGGFWVLLWSKEPRQLWWELRDEFERQVSTARIPLAPPDVQIFGAFASSSNLPDHPRFKI